MAVGQPRPGAVLLMLLAAGCSSGDALCEGPSDCAPCERCVRGVCRLDPSLPPCPAAADVPVAETLCEGGGTCVAPAPPGWQGPAIRLSTPGHAPQMACSGGYSLTSFEGFGGLIPGDASCGCSCDAPQGQVCGAASILPHPDCPTWPTTPQLIELAPNECVSLEAAMDETYRAVPAATLPTPGFCMPAAVVDIAEPRWTSQIKACVPGVAPPSCADGRVCAPPAGELPAEALCIHALGEVSCPEGEYSERTVYFHGLDDGRTCTLCTCNPPTEACGGQVDLSLGCQPDSIFAGQIPIGECTEPLIAPTHARYLPAPSPCTPATSELDGTARGNGAVTFCCRPSP